MEKLNNSKFINFEPNALQDSFKILGGLITCTYKEGTSVDHWSDTTDDNELVDVKTGVKFYRDFHWRPCWDNTTTVV